MKIALANMHQLHHAVVNAPVVFAAPLNKHSIMTVSVEAARHYLATLDLGYITVSMCAPTYPLPRWTQADAAVCEDLYKKFLLLQKIHPGLPLVPTKEIDEFWHNHILHTKQYHHDCQQIFGHYFHHQPASQQENPQQLVDDYARTRQLFFAEFKIQIDLAQPSS